MKILVTGGLGLIGHNVVKRLQDQGHVVSIMDTRTNYGIIPQEEINYLMEERVKKINIDGLYESDISDAKEVERLNSLIFKLMAKNVGQKENYFLDIVHQKGHADWYLNIKEAKKHKLCTHVGIPELTIKVSVDYQFE